MKHQTNRAAWSAIGVILVDAASCGHHSTTIVDMVRRAGAASDMRI